MSKPEKKPEKKSKGKPGKPEPKPPTKKESVALQLVAFEAFKEEIKAQQEVFHTKNQETFATIEVNGHMETHPLLSVTFQERLEYLWYVKHRTPMPEMLLKTWLKQWAAEAKWGGPKHRGIEHPVFLRVGSPNATEVFIDLCNDAWEVVHITASDWTVTSTAPVKFIRKEGMLPLPVPQHDLNALQHLDEFLAHLDKDGRILCKGFLLGCLNPHGPYPSTVIMGEQDQKAIC
jgi:putative DNA primase/helicase